MVWDEASDLSGLLYLHDLHSPPLGPVVISEYIGQGDPLKSRTTSDWQQLAIRRPPPTEFRMMGVISFTETIRTRAIRILSSDREQGIHLGELIACRQLGNDPLP